MFYLCCIILCRIQLATREQVETGHMTPSHRLWTFKEIQIHRPKSKSIDMEFALWSRMDLRKKGLSFYSLPSQKERRAPRPPKPVPRTPTDPCSFKVLPDLSALFSSHCGSSWGLERHLLHETHQVPFLKSKYCLNRIAKLILNKFNLILIICLNEDSLEPTFPF